jgi:GTP-binding protein
LIPPKIFTVEEAVSYIRDNELVEVTPKEIRIRKKELDSGMRRKIERDAKNR